MANTSVSLTDHHKRSSTSKLPVGAMPPHPMLSVKDCGWLRNGRSSAKKLWQSWMREEISETRGGRHIADDAFYDDIKKRGRQRLRAKLADLNKAA